jgi:hypothetical protein
VKYISAVFQTEHGYEQYETLLKERTNSFNFGKEEKLRVVKMAEVFVVYDKKKIDYG